MFLLLLIIFFFIQAISKCTFRDQQHSSCVYGRQKCVSCGACFFYLEWKERKNKILHGCDLQIFEIVASVWLHSIILVWQWSIIITPCLHYSPAGWKCMLFLTWKQVSWRATTTGWTPWKYQQQKSKKKVAMTTFNNRRYFNQRNNKTPSHLSHFINKN